MAINYGSNFKPPVVLSSEIGRKTPKKRESHAWLNWLTIIGEIGLTLIPGVGPVASTAIALGGAGARVGIAAGYGDKVSTLGTVFDFASAGIPGASAAISGARSTSKFIKAGEEAFADSSAGIERLQKQTFDIVMSGKFGQTRETIENSFRILEIQKNVGDVMRSTGELGRISGSRKLTDVLRELGQKEAATEIGPLASLHSRAGFFTETPEHILKAFRKYSRFGAGGAETIDESLIQKFARAGITEEELFKIGEKLGLGDLAINERNLKIVIQRINAMGANDTKQLRKVFKEVVEHHKLKELYRNKRTLKGAWRRINSSEFYGRDVQYVQAAFDPNDLGRAPIEFLYKKAKRKIDDWFEKNDHAIMEHLKKFGKNAKVVNKNLAKDIEIWEKNGGLTIKSSYLFGIKPLGISFGHGLFKKEKVLVRFHKNTTNTKTGKNVGGKKDVIVNMTQKQMLELHQQGSSYWWANGKKYGWFTSRGGKAKFGSLSEVSGKVSMYLGLLPVQAFRALGSIFSNLSQFGWGMANGEFQETYFEKLTGSFIRSAEGRAGRLLGKAVVGGLATKALGKRAGYSIGMLAQGVSGAGIHSIKGQGSWKQNFMKLGMARTKSELMIHAKGGSVGGRGNGVTQTLTGQRYFGITRGFGTGIIAPFKHGGKRPKIPKIGF